MTRNLVVPLLALGLLSTAALAQPAHNNPLDPQPNGPRKTDLSWHILLGPTVHIDPDQTLESGIIEIRDGRIVAVTDMTTVRFAPPPGAQVHDLAGMHVYAGFIDPHLAIDAPLPDRDAPGAHWNASVTPQRSALDATRVPAEDAKRLRALGFAAAAIAPEGGIFAGRASLVSLAEPPSDPSDGRAPVYRTDVFQTLSFSTRGPSNRGEFSGYPDSQMGAIALIRQTLLDADWEAQTHAGDPASCLALLAPDGGPPLLFRARDELEGLRAGKIAREFERPFAILGSGSEFRRLDAVAANDCPGISPMYIVPLTFPEAPDVFTIGAADSVSLRDLMTWEQAPTNARRLDDAGVFVSLTASGLRRGEEFDENLRRAIEVGGLAPERALAMLTTRPAVLLGVEDLLGTVQAGRIANLVIATGDLLAPKPDANSQDSEDKPAGKDKPKKKPKPARILDVWIDGERYAISDPDPPFDGHWTLRVGDAFEMQLVIDGEKVTGIEGEGEDANEGDARKVKMDPVARTISFILDDTDDGTGTYVQSGALGPDGIIRGTGLAPDGSAFEWTATPQEPKAEEPAPEQPADAELDGQAADKNGDDDKQPAAPALPPADLPGYPFGPYALDKLPPQQTVIFQNGTVWTSGPQGVLENGWVVIEEGKVVAVGAGVMEVLTRHDPITIDLHGRHITPGLIDAHSHTGISGGVNEGGQAVTAEVRIADVTDPDDINWYRQLAGGLTVVNNLHGSANPIGGQSQTNKIRWGVVNPDDMHMEGAKPGIKFALGENVKQSNWGDGNTTRYPQTRMGVETLIRDRFAAAREYGLSLGAQATAEERIGEMVRDIADRPELRQDLGSVSVRVSARSPVLRRDLELEALAEILAGERLLHCHSYRQDEILMLCRVAEDFGFKIGTFQHGLEVYKVAEAVRQDALGASLFADWWAYKVEVQDAIPQAGPLQTEAGVLTSYNSDSDELARRLNVEAAKAVKYSGGRLSEADALRFVTLNPAIQLGIGDRVGSIEMGKDADLAIWSGNPLSSFSRCEATYVDGREYFSLERDAALREQNSAARQRITQKILTEGVPKGKKKDAEEKEEPAGEPPQSLRERIAHAARLRHNLDLYLRGIDPATHLCGDCGQTELQLGGAR